MAKLEVNFTKRIIEDLPVPEPGKRTEAYDAKTPGLIVRITGSGARTFAVIKKVRGKTQRIKIGDYPAMSIEQARKKSRINIGLMTEGRDLAEEKRNAARELRKAGIENTTLAAAFSAYLESRPLKPRTVADYEECMRLTFRDWQPLPLKSITRTMIEERRRHRSNSSKARANHAMRILRAVFNYQMETLVDEHDDRGFWQSLSPPPDATPPAHGDRIWAHFPMLHKTVCRLSRTVEYLRVPSSAHDVSRNSCILSGSCLLRMNFNAIGCLWANARSLVQGTLRTNHILFTLFTEKYNQHLHRCIT